MKLKSNILVIGSVAAYLASPMAFAEGGNDAVVAVEEPADVNPGGEIVTEDGVVADEEIVVCDEDGDQPCDPEITGEPVDGEVTDGGEVVAGPGEEADPVEGGVPIDWVKRGGGDLENPDVIFYNMAPGGATPGAANGGEALMFKGGVEPGQDEKGSAIEAKGGSAGPQVQRVKKGPVALVKKGRVFLR